MALNAHSDTTALRQMAAATGTAAEERNKAACEALDALISMRNYAAAKRSWSPGDRGPSNARRHQKRAADVQFPSWPRFRHPSTGRAAHRAIAPTKNDAP
jgi:Ni/Co efflux regulator RcnB